MKLAISVLGTPVLVALAPSAAGQCELDKLHAADAGSGEEFGQAVAVQAGTLLVGAHRKMPGGAAYVFERDDRGTPTPLDDVWIQTAKLVSPEPAGGVRFGWAVALRGDTALVGDPEAGVGGKAYAFARDEAGTPGHPLDDRWIFAGTVAAVDTSLHDRFGHAVALHGTTALVTACYEDEAGSNAGAAYVFERDDAGTPSDPGDDSWSQTAKLVGSDTGGSDWFGYSTSLGESTALLGAWLADDVDPFAGAAYVFERDDGGTPADPLDDAWREIAKLCGSAFQGFGRSVSQAGDTLLVGAEPIIPFGTDPGRACVFERDDNGTPGDPFDDSWLRTAELVPVGMSEHDGLACSVALSADMALLGARGADLSGWPSGAVCVFERHDPGTPGDPFDDAWIESPALIGHDQTGVAAFGISVAMTEDVAVIGASLDAEPGTDCGSAFVFELGHPPAGFQAETTWISTGTGGAQELVLRTCPLSVGDLFWVMGTTSGTEPGFLIAGLPMPLNPDAYFDFTVLHPNTPPLTESLGFLEADGERSAFFGLPPRSSSLAGLALHHAFLVLDLATTKVVLTSNAVPLDLLP